MDDFQNRWLIANEEPTIIPDTDNGKVLKRAADIQALKLGFKIYLFTKIHLINYFMFLYIS
jgi:hypothetical protein